MFIYVTIILFKFMVSSSGADTFDRLNLFVHVLVTRGVRQHHPSVPTGISPDGDLVSIEAAILKSCESASSSHPHCVNIIPVCVERGEELEPLLTLCNGEQPPSITISTVIGDGTGRSWNLSTEWRLVGVSPRSLWPSWSSSTGWSLLTLELKAEGVDVPAEGLGELRLAVPVAVEPGEEGGGEALLVRLRPAKVLLHRSRRQLLLLPLQVFHCSEHTCRGTTLVGETTAIHIQVELTLTSGGVPSHVPPALAPSLPPCCQLRVANQVYVSRSTVKC